MTRYFYLTLLGGLATCGGSLHAKDNAPTFNKDVAPILFAHCTSCHRPDEVGPFPLQTYEDARKRGRQIARLTQRKIMPPWKPTAGPEVFKHARVLTEKQLALIRDWVEAGMPEGEAKDLPPLPKFPSGWHLGKPDLIVQVAKPYKIPAEGPDIYVHFVLPLDFQQEKYVKAVQVLPSNRRVAHHGVPILDGSGTARRLAKKHGGDHYPNFGGPGFIPRGFLPGYAPGQMTRIDETDPRGITLGKGIDIVLQMHYHPTGKEEYDQPQIGLYFTDKKPERNIAIIGMANNDVDIPPGARGHKRSDTFKVPVDFEVRDVWAHMHMIGKEAKAWAELPTGKKIDLLHIPDWDFNWQDTYTFQKPFVLPKGTVIHAEWTWDNTEDNPRNPFHPPRRIIWGEGSTDEMTGLIIGGQTVRASEEWLHWLSVLGHYLDAERKANEAKRKRQ